MARWGQSNVAAAYREMVNYELFTGWNIQVMNHSLADDRAEYAQFESQMTPTCRAGVEALITKALSGDKDAQDRLFLSVFYNVHGPNGAQVVDGPGGVMNIRWGGASISIDASTGYPRLAMTIPMSVDLYMRDAQSILYKVSTSRTESYWLVPSATPGVWLVDGLGGRWHSDPAQKLN